MSIINYTLPLFIFQFIELSFFAQETERENKIDFFVEANYSYSLNTNHKFGLVGVYGDNYNSLTDKGSSVQSANSTLGIEWRKWMLGGKIGFHKVTNDIDFVRYSPMYPLIKKDFNYQQNNLSVGMSIEKLILLNKSSFLSLGLSLSHFINLNNAYNEGTFEYFNENNQESVVMTTESYINKGEYPLIELSLKLFSVTKIGDFGIGINLIRLPERFAHGYIYEDRDNLPITLRYGFGGNFLASNYIGFSIAYQWKKRK